MIQSSIEYDGCFQISIHYTYGRNTIIHKPGDKNWLYWRVRGNVLIKDFNLHNWELIQVFVNPSREEAILTFKEDKEDVVDSESTSGREENRSDAAR